MEGKKSVRDGKTEWGCQKQTLVRDTTNSKLWKAMITHILKTHSTKKNETEEPS